MSFWVCLFASVVYAGWDEGTGYAEATDARSTDFRDRSMQFSLSLLYADRDFR